MKKMQCEINCEEFYGYPVDGFRHFVKFVYLLQLKSEYVIYIEEASPII